MDRDGILPLQNLVHDRRDLAQTRDGCAGIGAPAAFLRLEIVRGLERHGYNQLRFLEQFSCYCIAYPQLANHPAA